MLKRTFFSTVLSLAALIPAGAMNASSPSCANNMDEKIKKMTKEIDQLFAEDYAQDDVQNKKIIPVKQVKQTPTQHQQLSIDQEGNNVIIKLVIGKNIKSIDASVEDNLLSVNLSDKNQKIYVRYNAKHNYLSVAQGSSVQETTDKEGMHQEIASYSSMQQGQTLVQPIKLNEAKVEYKNDTLTILIPKMSASKEPQKIKVSIK